MAAGGIGRVVRTGLRSGDASSETVEAGGVSAVACRCGSEARVAWSPQQISGWLVEAFPDDPEMRVSHETIYLSLFVQSRGALRKELSRYLRSGHSTRRPRGHTTMNGRGQLRGTLNIRERPADARTTTRIVPRFLRFRRACGELRRECAGRIQWFDTFGGDHSGLLAVVRCADVKTPRAGPACRGRRGSPSARRPCPPRHGRCGPAPT